jgi:hypothetical protein
MSTSGVSAFTLNLNEIVEEAFERAGGQLRSGYDLRTARRSLNLLFADWANRGINLWTVEQGSFTLTPGLMTYPLPVDTVDLLEHVIRTQANNSATQADLTITRISVSTYATIPNKITQARPIQIYVNRQSGNAGPTGLTLNGGINASVTSITLSSTVGLPASGYVKIGNETIFYSYIVGNVLSNCFRGQNNTTAASHLTGVAVSLQQLPCVTLWPVPDDSQTYSLVYWRMRRIQDASSGITDFDIPFRFITCLTAGLSYYLALKIPEGMTRLDVLKSMYDEAWDLAAGEDREKAADRLVPRQMFIDGANY